MIAKAVAGRVPAVAPEAVAVLASPAEGWLAGCLKLAVQVPLAIILFPIRKIMNIVFAVRHVSRDLVEIVLLGRLAERALDRGWIDPVAPARDQRRQALTVRKALDRAMKKTSTEILSAGVQAAIGPVGGLMRAGLATLRGMRKSESDAVPSADLTEGASRIERAFDRPEIRALIERIEGRIEAARDELLANERSRNR